MTTDFFNHIAAIATPGNWKLTIQTGDNVTFTVSALFTAAGGGDIAARLIPPMILQGTAEELGAGFFEAITTPVQQTANLYANMEQYQKQLEAAKLASKQEQDKKQKDKAASQAQNATGKKTADMEMPDAKAEKRKVYETAMKSITELTSVMKYEEALSILPDVALYPEKEAELNNKQADLLRLKDLKAQRSLELL